MSNTRTRLAGAQLALNSQREPGRPTIEQGRRRKNKSITLSQDLIVHFDEWTYKKRLSFSRGVEAAILAFMQGSDSDADV